VSWSEFEAIEFAQNFDPAHGPLEIGVTVDVLQWAERQLSLRAGKVVEFPTHGLGEHPDGIAAVEGEDLGARIGPSEPSGRRRLQTAVSCFGQKPRW
jgi:hypothetical protein